MPERSTISKRASTGDQRMKWRRRLRDNAGMLLLVATMAIAQPAAFAPARIQDGLYIGKLQLTLGVTLEKVRHNLGAPDAVSEAQPGTRYTWERKDGTTVTATFNDLGGLLMASAELNSAGGSRNKTASPIFALHTYTGKKRVVRLGQTTMSQVRSWFGYGTDSATGKSTRHIPATIERYGEWTLLYSWSYEFDEEAAEELRFGIIIRPADRQRPQEWKDARRVQYLEVSKS